MINTIKEKIQSQAGRAGGARVGTEMLLYGGKGWGGGRKSCSKNIWADTWRKRGSQSQGGLKELSKWRETAVAEALECECGRRKRPGWWEHREKSVWRWWAPGAATRPRWAGPWDVAMTPSEEGDVRETACDSALRQPLQLLRWEWTTESQGEKQGSPWNHLDFMEKTGAGWRWTSWRRRQWCGYWEVELTEVLPPSPADHDSGAQNKALQNEINSWGI